MSLNKIAYITDFCSNSKFVKGLMVIKMEKLKLAAGKAKIRVSEFMKNTDGDQITGWLIVVLLVVVVGAFFLNTYQSTIEEIWTAIVQKIYTTFGI